MKLRILPLLIVLSSCSHAYDSRLIDIETYINDCPDSALCSISSIDPTSLPSRADKALHSLLYSMALDKCYIDTTDVSVVQPAYSYFRRHGSSDYRLKAVYYRARIAENAGDMDLAKEILVRHGDKYVDCAQDLSFAGKYLMMHCKLSKLVFDFEKAIMYAGRAKIKYEQCGEARGFASACFGMSSSMICLLEYDAAKEVLSEVRAIWDSIDEYRKCTYYRESICIAIYQENFSLAEELAEECIASCSGMRFMPWIDILDAFVSVGRYEEALEISNLIDNFDKAQEGHLTTTRAELFAACGDYRSAYDLEKHFIDVIWQEDKFALESDIRFMESRISSEVSRVRMVYTTIIVIVALVLALLLIVYLFCLLKRKVNQAKTIQTELEKERKELLCIKESSVIDDDTRELIGNRINLINKVLLVHLSGSSILNNDNVQEMNRILEDRQAFVSSIAILFSVSHPRFISYLRKCDLREFEIGYCCLLVQGLSAKEISSIFNLPRFYHLASSIRSKLSIPPNDKNLKTYLISLLQSEKTTVQ